MGGKAGQVGRQGPWAPGQEGVGAETGSGQRACPRSSRTRPAPRFVRGVSPGTGVENPSLPPSDKEPSPGGSRPQQSPRATWAVGLGSSGTQRSPSPKQVETGKRNCSGSRAGGRTGSQRGPTGKAGQVAQGCPGAGRLWVPPPHRPGPGRGEEAPGRVCGPLLDAGVAQPVHQPLVQQAGLVCRGRGDNAAGNELDPTDSGRWFWKMGSPGQSPCSQASPAPAQARRRPARPPSPRGPLGQWVPSWRLPGARLVTFDRTGRRGLRLGPSGCRLSRILKTRWATFLISCFLSPCNSNTGGSGRPTRPSA